jgi:hypothetical protein
MTINAYRQAESSLADRPLHVGHMHQDSLLLRHASNISAHVLDALVRPGFRSPEALVGVGLCCLLLTLAESKSRYCHFQTEILARMRSFGQFSAGCSLLKSQGSNNPSYSTCSTFLTYALLL